MEIQRFKAHLVKPDTVGAWTYLTVPFKADEVFASKARIPVKGTISGVPYLGSLLPHGDGRHYMVVNKDLRESCGASNGDQVEVTMQFDEDKRTNEIPLDLEAALAKSVQIKTIFSELAYSHQKEYIEWIISAKKAETRTARIEKALLMIAE
ncbi:DUF1905 domain-containing protein [Paenibacillus psychroresistens]|uniref:DUF1905 domain-containing protein n=1 Tax=Paenibacillus psychroresistens TaxID=1778678 RepID=A0A6B8RQQ5_9BACL|nr:YdeI/OmpD-associated family protein [Paenibacillus psychroresistens]QGQ97823.1 DUF1905 domain-containing protein [Paenibacillus psychroresistens]